MDIHYICSFGPICHTATFMWRNQLKLVSYPFDWIYANHNNIISIIEDDFKIFLDKSYYIDCETKYHDVECGHSYYDNNMFRHKDPRNENDYSYYERCITRFRNLLKYDESKLFVIVFTNMQDTEDSYGTVKKNIIEFNAIFSKYTTNYTLLVVYNLSNKYEHYHNSEHVDNIHFLELHTCTKSNGVIFEWEADNLFLQNTIKSTYNFVLNPI